MRFERTTRARTLPDPVTHEAVREVRESLEELRRTEIVGGRHIERTDPNDKTARHIEVEPGASANIVKIKHGLGRPVRGWQVSELQYADDIADVTAAGTFVRVMKDGTATPNDDEIWLKPIGFTVPSGKKLKLRLWTY